MANTSVLTINSTNYNQSARRTAKYLIDGWGWDLDSAGFWLKFHEYLGKPQPTLTGPVPVSLSINSTTVFSGDLIGVEPAWEGPMRTWTYQCAGLEYRANWIPVTAVDESGLMRFNVDPTNLQYYVEANAGQSVGQIISTVLTDHSTALGSAGITTDGTTSSELSALTLVPNSEVQIAGGRLWQALQQFLNQWQRNIRLMINAAGNVRCIDVTAGTSKTLTLGTDPIDPPLFSRNWATSATRVVVRGQGNIGSAYVTTLGASPTLTGAWNTTQAADWVYSDFTDPTGPSNDTGTVNSVTSATTVGISSSDATRTWATNYWSGIEAWIYLLNSSGSGITWTECRPVTANGSLSAAGSCSVTLAYALENSTSSAYNSYQMIGTNVPLASGGLYDVYRLYNVTDPGGYVADHLTTLFPIPMPFYGLGGTSVVLTTAPTCQIVGSDTAVPAPFAVMPQTGQVMFLRPTVEINNSVATLNAGGTGVTAPEVYMMLPYSRGALISPYPADSGGTPQYSGTAYTVAGLERSLYVDQYDWRYGGNAPVLNGLAQMTQVSLCNTLVEGTITYKGLYADTQDPSGGFLINIAAAHYTTGDESLDVPLRAYAVTYATRGGGLNYTTTLRVSTRQDPKTGESFFDHLSPYGGGRIQIAATQGGGYFSAGQPNYLPGVDAEMPGGNSGFSGDPFEMMNAMGGPGEVPGKLTDAEKIEAWEARNAADSAKSRKRAEANKRRAEARAQTQRTPRAGELMYGGSGAGGAASAPSDDAVQIAADQAENARRAQESKDKRDTQAKRQAGRTPRPGELLYGDTGSGGSTDDV